MPKYYVEVNVTKSKFQNLILPKLVDVRMVMGGREGKYSSFIDLFLSFVQGLMACMFNKGENCIAAG